MGLGLPAPLAQIFGDHPVIATAYGTSAGSANQIGGNQYNTLCFTGTSSFALPQVGGDGIGKGALLSDEYSLTNFTGADLKVYAANNAAGSAVTIYARGGSVVGTTGMTLVSGYPCIFKVISVSTYLALQFVASA